MQTFLTKKEAIYNTLKQRIYNEDYKFGEKLVISKLAKEFGSSEIPIREALNQLEADSLIDIKPHVGARIKTLSSKEIKNIFDVRTELESLATKLAAEHLKAEDFKELRDIIDNSKSVYLDHDYEKYRALNFDFHMKIYKRCENEYLLNLIKDLWMNSSRYPMVFDKNDTFIEESLQEHEDIYQALKNRDGEKAKQITSKHKTRAAKEIIRLAKEKYQDA